MMDEYNAKSKNLSELFFVRTGHFLPILRKDGHMIEYLDSQVISGISWSCDQLQVLRIRKGHQISTNTQKMQCYQSYMYTLGEQNITNYIKIEIVYIL